ncbi:uncharacterized protein EI90DRAFT_3152533 [Cantharellus anzutake]|uniref:uncharacterized protein n=1 Tax=Cantharellus anzutake TaxID=1750568 RepID=UPI001905B880|nr:uncharacterized protein EI90DRAFT_3152533 [Cantharellus anzutake]KAF8336329.1 hypothetical protein EI90DRAFT_3152533 [Cantharellus anzutake]
MTTLEPVLACMPYTLAIDCAASWADQSIASFPIASTYPFFESLSECAPTDFVLRVYYETLWLPEEIHSISRLVPALRRVETRGPTTSDDVTAEHPLRTILSPLLLSAQDIATKYRVEVPKLLKSSWEEEIGVEESLICFAITHARRREGEDEGAWVKRWLHRIERRETLIQVLLHFLVLSLPSPPPSAAERKRKRKHKRNLTKGHRSDAPMEDVLDILTDRLSIWRETEFVTTPRQPIGDSFQGDIKDMGQDWLQEFCEGIVRPEFSGVLSSLYESFRRKCFPTEDVPRSLSRSPSPALSSSSYANALQDGLQVEVEDARVGKEAACPRSRSRSHSVIAESVIDVKPRNLVIHRPDTSKQIKKEVSMRRSASVQLQPHVHREGVMLNNLHHTAKDARQYRQSSDRASSHSLIGNHKGNVSREGSGPEYVHTDNAVAGNRPLGNHPTRVVLVPQTPVSGRRSRDTQSLPSNPVQARELVSGSSYVFQSVRGMSRAPSLGASGQLDVSSDPLLALDSPDLLDCFRSRTPPLSMHEEDMRRERVPILENPVGEQ